MSLDDQLLHGPVFPRAVQAYGVDGTYVSITKATTPLGLRLEMHESGAVLVYEGEQLLAVYGHFFSVKPVEDK